MASFDDIDPQHAEPWLSVPCDWRRPVASESYTVLWDKARDFGQVWPRPDSDAIPAFYDVPDYYTHSASAVSEVEAEGALQKLQTRLAWQVDHSVEAPESWWRTALGPDPLDILEIGCGGGAILARLANLGHMTVGMEPDAKARAAAQAKGQTVHAGSAEHLPASATERSFGVILFMHVLEHTLSASKALTNALALLRPGGRLVVEVPNNACFAAQHFQELWLWMDIPRHLNFFTPKSLSALLESADLEIEDISYSGYTRQFSADWKAQQAQIAAAFGDPHDRRIGSFRYWSQLGRTAFAEDARKYDSVRIIARKP